MVNCPGNYHGFVCVCRLLNHYMMRCSRLPVHRLLPPSLHAIIPYLHFTLSYDSHVTIHLRYAGVLSLSLQIATTPRAPFKLHFPTRTHLPNLAPPTYCSETFEQNSLHTNIVVNVLMGYTDTQTELIGKRDLCCR